MEYMAKYKHADLLIRAKTYALPFRVPQKHALAVLDQHVLDISTDAHGLDHLIGPNTKIIQYSNACVFPSFDDRHTHFIFAGLSQFDVPVHTAKTLDELLQLIRQTVSDSEPGQWISTMTNWREYNLRREKRLPTTLTID